MQTAEILPYLLPKAEGIIAKKNRRDSSSQQGNNRPGGAIAAVDGSLNRHG